MNRHKPHFAWGFYGHRATLYRDTIPHDGFNIIKKWIERNNADYFVVTSNIDGQFQKAGYDEERVYEVHGSIHWLQYLARCNDKIWRNDEVFQIDETTMRASASLPRCLSEAFDQIRGSAAGNVGIMARLLGAFQTIASLTTDQRRRQALVLCPHLS
nr:hypothetical protein [Desulfobulbaceae bacterium]